MDPHGVKDQGDLRGRGDEAGQDPVAQQHAQALIATHVFKGPVARAYGYFVSGSIVTLRRAATGRRVIGFAPQRIYRQQGGELKLQIAPEQETAAVMAMWRAWGFVTKRPALPVTGVPAASPIAPA